MIKKVNGIKKVFVCAASMLLPLSINCIYLIVAEETVHTLVLFSFFAVYIFSIIVIDTIENWNQAGKIGKRLLLCGLCLVVINNIFVANKTYLKMQLAYENAFSFYTSVITQVKQTEGFDENSKLALVGDADELLYTDTTGNNNIMGVDKSLINVYSRDRFIKYYIGFDISFATEEEIDAIKNSAEFASMSRYPYYGSVSKIGNTIVVKFEQ